MMYKAILILLIIMFCGGCNSTRKASKSPLAVMHTWYGKTETELRKKWGEPTPPGGISISSETGRNGDKMLVYGKDLKVAVEDAKKAEDYETGYEYLGADGLEITLKVENRFYIDSSGKIFRWSITQTPVYE